MGVLDDLRRFLGGGDPEATGMAYASSQPSPDLLQYAQDMLSGKIAAGGALGQNYYDPNRSFAANALDPRAIEQATEVAGGIGPGAIRAYHASPYDFNKFDLGKIGTGEGAQAYGHGLYFAGNEATSKAGYLPQLKDIVFATSGRDKIRKGDAFEALIAATREKVPGLHPDQYRQIATALGEGIEGSGSIAKYLRDYELPGGQFGPAYQAAAQEAQRLGLKVNPGHMYEVDIHADPKALLDWDRPLSEQSPHVQGAIKSLSDVYPLRDISLDLLPGQTAVGRHAYGKLAKATSPDYDIGKAAASSELNQAGIPGIRYLDQGSRIDPVTTQQKIALYEGLIRNDPTAAERAGWANRIAELQAELTKPQTSNYAIFDPSIIEILRKYGILPPAVAAGGGLLGTGSEPPT